MPPIRLAALAAAFFVVPAMPGYAQPANAEVKTAFEALVPPESTVTKLADGFRFTEGPVWVPAGGIGGGDFLIFSDIPANRLHAWRPDGGVSVYREPSHQTNGNTVTAKGVLLSCQHGSRTVTRTNVDGVVETVAERVDGKRFNSPNDIVVAKDGSYWFTDPTYGLPKGEEREIDICGVYRFDPATGNVSLVTSDLDRPNGLAFSPDDRRLYIADSGQPKNIRVFDVGEDGRLTGGEIFAEIPKGAPDGMRCDADGNLWSSAGNGVRIFRADGTYLGLIPVPEAPTNLAFGGPDGKTLFITARTGLYAIPVAVGGDPPR